jgi:class 3 adenylate cyclase
VPEFIIKQHASKQTGGGFQAAGLFMDISGSSAITDALMAVLMRSVFDPLVSSVYERGGFIITFAGDAFTALFPLVDVQDEGPWRALSAAQRIREHMAEAREHVTPYGTFQVAAKVGLAAGDVSELIPPSFFSKIGKRNTVSTTESDRQSPQDLEMTRT